MRIVRFLLKLLGAFVAAVTAASLVSTAVALAARDRLRREACPADDDLDIVSILAETRFRSEATAFRGGRIVCWQAGGTVDLRAAQMDPAGAELEITVLFGGLGIRVPEDWRVRMRGVAVFGGAGSTAPSPDDDGEAPVLTVRYRVVFGGFGVVAEADDELVTV